MRQLEAWDTCRGAEPSFLGLEIVLLCIGAEAPRVKEGRDKHPGRWCGVLSLGASGQLEVVDCGHGLRLLVGDSNLSV